MIVTANQWQTFSGATLTTDQLASIGSIVIEVDAAIKRLCRPWLFEPQTFTNVILDAPLEDELLLPVIPVRSITSLYVSPAANGDPTLFTANDLLAPYTGYLLDLDDPVNGYSKSGVVYCRNAGGWLGGSGGSWGGEVRGSAGRLTGELTPGRRAIKVSFLAGCLTVPDDVRLAANMATSLIYFRRLRGVTAQSESWNGASYSLASPMLAMAALESPDVANRLSGYCSMFTGRS